MSEPSSNPKYILRFFFEAGSGICFWSANEAAKLRFDYPVQVEKLPLSASTRSAVNGLLRLYDESFNWKYPPDPGPWTSKQQNEFNLKVIETLNHSPAGTELETCNAGGPKSCNLLWG
jgi:hypothetical protein